MKRTVSKIKTIPFRGGCNTAVETALLDGQYSMVQNLRQRHPGLEKRKGQIKKHSTADSTNKVMSLYQFVKGKKTERHFYAQMSDSDVLEATDAPPAVTTGVFGSEVFSGTASPVPASWANLNDFLLFCNGVDLPQIYPGTGNYVDKFFVYSAGSTPTNIANVTSGTEYSSEVSDGDSTTYANLSNLATITAVSGSELVTNGAFASDTAWTHESYLTIADGVLKALDGTWGGQTTASQVVPLIAGMLYRLSFDYVKACTHYNSYVVLNGANLFTLTASNTYTLDFVSPIDSPTLELWVGYNGCQEYSTFDNVSITAYGYAGVFIKTPVPCDEFYFTLSSVNGDAAVANIKYWNGAFTDVTGFSDGTIASAGKTLGQSGSMTFTAPTDILPTMLYGETGYWYLLYLSSGMLGASTHVSSVTYEPSAWSSIVNMWDGEFVDVVEAQFYDQTAGTYSTFGASSITLNSMTASDALYISSYDDIESINVVVNTANTTATTTATVYRFDGNSWINVSATDNTAGFSKSSRFVFARGVSRKQEFQHTGYFAHWYKIVVDKTLSSAVNVSISVQPYFDIAEIGKGQTVCSWKNRAIYGTNQDHYCYVTGLNNPQVLNGEDYTMIEPGDGRLNRPVAIRNFKDGILIWQEEKGLEGGCLTKFEWVSSVDDIKKTLISTSLGAMNSKSVDVVDGVEFAEFSKDTPVMALAFCLSRSGVYVTDGNNCYIISKEINNYFDPTNSACIRSGYESEMWLKYDSAYGVIRIGLVSGSSATLPNIFPVYDIKEKCWMFDDLEQELSCMTEAEAASGNVPVVQLGGGVDDGTVYVLNSGYNDVTSAIDGYVTTEVDGNGEILHAREILLRAKVQTAGSITLTPSLNAIAGTASTLAETAETASQTIRRHRKHLDLTNQHLSFKIQHATVDQTMYLLDWGLAMDSYEEQ